MPIIESTPKRLVIKSGSTTFTLDRDSGKATEIFKHWERRHMGPIELLVGALITAVAGVAAGYAMYFIHRHFSKT